MDNHKLYPHYYHLLANQDIYIYINPNKSPFSYGFLWFSYGFPMVLGLMVHFSIAVFDYNSCHPSADTKKSSRNLMQKMIPAVILNEFPCMDIIMNIDMIYIYIYPYMDICVVYSLLLLLLYICMYLCIYVPMHLCMFHLCTYVSTFVSMYLCSCVFFGLCIYVSTCVSFYRCI